MPTERCPAGTFPAETPVPASAGVEYSPEWPELEPDKGRKTLPAPGPGAPSALSCLARLDSGSLSPHRASYRAQLRKEEDHTNNQPIKTFISPLLVSG